MNSLVEPAHPRDDRTACLITWGSLSLLVVVLMYSFWNTLRALGDYWQNPQYSHGYLVPAFAVVLLWMYRSNAPASAEQGKSAASASADIWKYAVIGVPAAFAGLLYLLSEHTPLGEAAGAVLSGLMMLTWCALIVGLLAVAVRWDPYNKIPESARWAGVGLLVLGLAMRLYFARNAMEAPEMVSFVPCLASLMLLAGGWNLFLKVGPAVAFLVFMFPLPWTLEQALLVPLMQVATVGSEYCLQVLGLGAYREGTVIFLTEGQPLNVAAECSGLRMLTIFVALCVAVAFLIERPWWERIVVILSSVPIAIASNIFRIVLIGIAYHFGREDIGNWIHDQAALIMMPAAMLLLFAEISILSKIVIEEELPEVRAVRTRGEASPKDRHRSRRGREGGDRTGRRREPVGS